MKKTPKHAKESFNKKQIIRYAAFALVGIIVGLYVYVQNSQGILRDKLPMPFGYGASVVLSGSMEPELAVDDLVIVKKTKNIDVNDVVVFQSGNSLVIHRVMEINGDEILTKGDANNAYDEPINIKVVKGVMVKKISNFGGVVRFFKQPVVLIIIIGGLLYLTEFSYKKEKKNKTDELEEIRKQIEELKSK